MQKCLPPVATSLDPAAPNLPTLTLIPVQCPHLMKIRAALPYRRCDDLVQAQVRICHRLLTTIKSGLMIRVSMGAFQVVYYHSYTLETYVYFRYLGPLNHSHILAQKSRIKCLHAPCPWYHTRGLGWRVCTRSSPAPVPCWSDGHPGCRKSVERCGK